LIYLDIKIFVLHCNGEFIKTIITKKYFFIKPPCSYDSQTIQERTESLNPERTESLNQEMLMIDSGNEGIYHQEKKKQTVYT